MRLLSRAGATATQRQIDITDHQIEQLVYELYGLTTEEIGIIEGETSANPLTPNTCSNKLGQELYAVGENMD